MKTTKLFASMFMTMAVAFRLVQCVDPDEHSNEETVIYSENLDNLQQRNQMLVAYNF